jgi:hypothetical protein
MTTFVVMLVIVIFFVLAIISFRRFRQDQRSRMKELRRAVEQCGYGYKERPLRGIDFRITGTREGIPWTLEQFGPAPADDLTTPTLLQRLVDLGILLTRRHNKSINPKTTFVGAKKAESLAGLVVSMSDHSFQSPLLRKPLP